MALQATPYALQNASHSASLFRSATSAPFNPAGGILGTGELSVAQSATPAMSVVLGSGRASVAGTAVSPPAGFTFTSQSSYFCENDAPLTLTVTASNPTNPRIDICVVSVQDAFYSGSNNQAVASIVAGTPAVSPVAPSAPSNSIILATIAVAANATTIVTANIANVAALVTVVNTATSAALAAAVAPIGLTRVVPSSITGSGAALSTNGRITLTAATIFSVTGCFSSKFDNYLVTYTGTWSGLQFWDMTLQVAGTPSAVGYDEQRLFGAASVASASRESNQNFWIVGIDFGYVNQWGKIDVFSPFLTGNTQALFTSGESDGAGNITVVNETGWHRTVASYDGFVFSRASASNTFSGVVEIFGYNTNV